MARALCLIALPAALYVSIFYLHLEIINETGPGDGFFSSAYQVSLKGNYLNTATTPKGNTIHPIYSWWNELIRLVFFYVEVAFGAVLSLKNHIVGGGYLHSHNHLYPATTGASQQQITTYIHKDVNNNWHIKRFNRMAPSWNSTKPIDFVRNGDYIRLEHLETGRNLHSHRLLAPLTKKHLMVTAYGEVVSCKYTYFLFERILM